MVDRRRQWRAENQEISITEQLSRQAYLVNGTQGIDYIVTLDDPSCRCRDWEKRSPDGGCKHILKIKLEEGLIDPLPSAKTNYGASSDRYRGEYSDDWESLSLQTRKRDNWECQLCGVKGGPEGDTQLNAHHIIPKSKGGEDSADNLISVCVDCHEEEHGHPISPPNTNESGCKPFETSDSRQDSAGNSESDAKTSIDKYVSEVDPQVGLRPRESLHPPKHAYPSQNAQTLEVSSAETKQSNETIDPGSTAGYQEEREVPKDRPERDGYERGNPINLVTGIGAIDQPTAHTLWEAGYTTSDDIAAASLDDLMRALGNDQELASRIKISAGDEPENEQLGSSIIEPSAHDSSPVDGHEDTGVESTDVSQSEEDNQEVEQPPISELVDNAEGNVEEKDLTENKSNRPLREHLRPNEQPHYYFKNVNKGLRFTHPDWDGKETPYNVGWSHPGTRYLLLTDQRVLFVGGEPEGTDTVESFSYTDLCSVDSNLGWTKSRLTVDHADGRSISFFNNGSESSYIEEAGRCVARRIQEAEE